MSGMFKSDPPPAPDYTGAAQQQGQQNVYAAIAQNLLNRPNEVNPYGSRTWQQTGTQPIGGGYDIPTYQSTTSLTPTGQNLFNLGNQIQTGMGETGVKALGAVQDTLGQPLDLSGAPQLPTDLNANRDQVTNALYQRSTRMLDPQWQQSEEAERTRLANAGFSQGDDPAGGYARAMGNFQRAKDYSYGQARDTAIAAGGAEQTRQQGLAQAARNQAIQEILLRRQQPLAELSSLRTGAAPQMPQFQPYSANASVAPAPTFAATQAAGQYGTDVYNSQVAQQNAMLQGLFSLGSAYTLGSTMPRYPGTP